MVGMYSANEALKFIANIFHTNQCHRTKITSWDKTRIVGEETGAQNEETLNRFTSAF